MEAVLTVLVCVVLVIAVDWLATGSVAAKAWSFDYQYWPPSKARLVSVILLAAAVTIIGLFMKPDPDNPPVWWVFVIVPAVMIWAGVAWADFMAQRRSGFREPPNYSDPDFDADG